MQTDSPDPWVKENGTKSRKKSTKFPGRSENIYFPEEYTLNKTLGTSSEAFNE